MQICIKTIPGRYSNNCNIVSETPQYQILTSEKEESLGFRYAHMTSGCKMDLKLIW
jgi:hypothetical protein